MLSHRQWKITLPIGLFVNKALRRVSDTRKIAEASSIDHTENYEVIKSAAQKPHELRDLIRGIVWRDEHFNGMTIRDLAVREGHSEVFVGRLIHETFDTI
jgi:hypothetical protein